VPKAMTLIEIVDRTQKDPDLQAFITAVKTNRGKQSFENSVLNTFTKLRYELIALVPVNDSEILLHDNRIVISKDLHMRVIDLAHEGHQRRVRTNQPLREKVHFPGIDKLVEKLVSHVYLA
jgi:hypothetical protein